MELEFKCNFRSNSVPFSTIKLLYVLTEQEAAREEKIVSMKEKFMNCPE